MTGYKHQYYRSPIDLPEAQSGSMRIQHQMLPVGSTTPVVGMRQAVLRGIRPIQVQIGEEPLRIHKLVEDGRGTWMTDLPEELNQIGELMYSVGLKPNSRILVGGLGLGILAATVSQVPGSKVTVVEKSKDVINLCAQPQYETVEMDIHDYLRTTKQEFDFYLLDTWAGTNESTWWEEVMPMRRVIRQRWGMRPVVHCWAEDIMLGQIIRSLTYPQPHWYMTYLPVPMSEQDAKRFVRDVGSTKWEKKYGQGVDRYAHDDVIEAPVAEGQTKTSSIEDPR